MIGKVVFLAAFIIAGTVQASEVFVPGATLRLINLSSHSVDFKFGKVGSYPFYSWQDYHRETLEPNESRVVEGYVIPCNTNACIQATSRNPNSPNVFQYFDENHKEYVATFFKFGIGVTIDVAATQLVLKDNLNLQQLIENFVLEYKTSGIEAAKLSLGLVAESSDSFTKKIIEYLIANSDTVCDMLINPLLENASDIIMSWALAKYVLAFAIDSNSDNWLNHFKESHPELTEALVTAGCFVIHKGANKYFAVYKGWALANPGAAALKAGGKGAVKGAAYYGHYLYNTKKSVSEVFCTEKEGVFLNGQQGIEAIVTDYNNYTISLKVCH